MKELSIEEKAKRYDELLVKLQEAKVDNNVCDDRYCCVIDDIVPELKESGDERIRKHLIKHFGNKSKTAWNGMPVDKIIAWLEKQAEQKTILPWKYKKDNTPLLRDSLILNKYGCVANSPSGALVSDVWVMDYDELAKLPKEEFEKQGEKPAEWSEEDEDMLQNILECLRHGWKKTPTDILNYENWLKSLRPQNRWISIDKEVYVKEPVLAQKKDKSDQFKGYVVCCDHTLVPNIYERYIRLDNNCSQNTWKPSEEQMEYLAKAITTLGNEGDNKTSAILYELRTDLKKLKG